MGRLVVEAYLSPSVLISRSVAEIVRRRGFRFVFIGYKVTRFSR